MASTFLDDTGAATVAAAVVPPGILGSLWSFQEGTWVGYSPRYPEASDLVEIDFTQTLFICVTAPGRFLRPAA